ncbi:hypothetical protein BDD43_2151 [Mucilaginibacter gracilis]|uniref:Uncharacterized protein n=1 Tax=Mucilaginibacter gracilis TaxID=423350 RepID=A0A495J0W2_9SPHI|nr:hypothetical protein [Mucilaginibacter gracilis]RKR81988.1 hypothetical protein BDD43_2151 [Mucilaginibacter gracilis]
MAVVLTLVLSLLALLTTYYQAYLQRVHNQKSVKPLAQIDFEDRDGTLFVHVQNNGVGPFTVDKLIFTRNGKTYDRIEDSLEIDPKRYYHVEVNDTNKKVIIPGGFLVVFSETLNPNDNQETIDLFRQELSKLHLKVEGHDIYDNSISIEKSLKWFGRHL